MTTILAVSTFLAALALQPELISRRGIPLPDISTAAGTSGDASFSGNGRYVIFSSDAPNVVSNDANGAKVDVFRRDLATGRIELVSVLPGQSASPPAHASVGSLSDDGQTAVFLSQGAMEGDRNSAADVFVRYFATASRETAVTELVSIRATGEGTGNGGASLAVISGDGRWIMFESTASDLVSSPDVNQGSDIFLRDLQEKRTIRLSSLPTEDRAGSGPSRDPVMSRDASVVAFRSDATNLTAALTGNVTDLYLWTRGGSGLRRIVVPGVQLTSSQLPLRAINPILSPDGRYLAFRTSTSQSGHAANAIWWFDLQEGTNVLASAGLATSPALISDDGSGPVMSGDGRTIAFEVLANVQNLPKVYLWKADSGVHAMDSLMLTVPPVGGEPATSEAPVLSADAAQIAFLTYSSLPGTDITVEGGYRLVVRNLVTGKSYAPPIGPDAFAYDAPFPEFHPDGSRILFQTSMVIGTEADENRTFDVFLADPSSGSLSVVSKASAAMAAVAPDGTSSAPGQPLSGDGRFVGFASLARDVIVGKTNSYRDIFRYDRQTGQTLLVSRGVSGANANGSSTTLQVSLDGRFVLFSSQAKNLVAGDTNNFEDVYLADCEVGTLTLVSAKAGTGASSSLGGSSQALLSADGHRVLFVSTVRDYVAGVTGGFAGSNVFLREVATQRTRLLSRDTVGGTTGIQGRVLQAALSENGMRAAFVAGLDHNRDVYLYDVATETLQRLTTNQAVANLALSPDGQRLAYIRSVASAARPLMVVDLATGQSSLLLEFAPGAQVESFRFTRDGYSLVFVTADALPAERTGINDTNNRRDVFRLDVRANTLNLVSVGPEGQLGNEEANQPAASADGRKIVFRSTSSNLAAGDANKLADVFLWEADSGRSRLLSANPATGLPADNLSTTPAISSDGRFVLFVSAASDLVAGDANSMSDVFGLTLEPAAQEDSDSDGLPDAWEMASFGNLNATAASDDDGDGRSNLEEFIAGTHPANPISVLRLNVQSITEMGIVLNWSSQAGVTYVIETATELSPAAFKPGSPAIIGDGSAKTMTLPIASDHGFLRLRAQR